MGEGIGILCIGRLCGSAVGVDGCRAVCVGFRGFNALNDPSNGVGIDACREYSSIGGVTRYSHDIGRPVGEGIGILCIGRLFGGRSLVYGNLAFCDINLIKGGTIVISEDDMVIGHGRLRAVVEPEAVSIYYEVAGSGTDRFEVAVVHVAQFCRGDGDSMGSHIGTALGILIGHGLRAGCACLLIDTCAVGADVRAAGSGINCAGSNHGSKNIDSCIHKVCFRAVVGLAGGEDNAFKFSAGDIVVSYPFIPVIEIDAVAFGNQQFGAAANGDIHAGKQGGRLVDSQFAGSNLKGDIVGNRENIVGGVDVRSGKVKGEAVQFHIAIDGKQQPVSCPVIRFGDAAGGQLEHTVFADKGNGGVIDLAACIYTGVDGLRGPGIDRHRSFHILDEVLGKGEHLVAH